MKVQKTTTQPEFQPVTLQITIESQEEFDLLKNLFGAFVAIPLKLSQLGYVEDEKAGELRNIMRRIWDTL